MSTNAMWVHTMQLMYTIDDYQWLRTMPAAEAPIDAKSWAEALPPWWFWPRTTPRYEPHRDMNHKCGTGWHIECRISLGVEIRRNRSSRLRSGGNGSIQFRNLGPEEMWSIERSFCLFCLFSSLLHTSLLHWILARYKWRRHRFLPPSESVKWRWTIPVRRIRRKIAQSGTNW